MKKDDVILSQNDKESLEDYFNQVLKCDNVSLLSHYTGAVRTHETDEENREYFRIVIDTLSDEILKRMK